MLAVFVTSALLMGLSMAAMALGHVLRDRPLRHGCGEATGCEGCRRPCARDDAGEEARCNAR